MAEKSPIEPPEPSPADADELRAFLTDPASYGLSSGKVETIETHAAHVFLAGNKAYKINHSIVSKIDRQHFWNWLVLPFTIFFITFNWNFIFFWKGKCSINNLPI